MEEPKIQQSLETVTHTHTHTHGHFIYNWKQICFIIAVIIVVLINIIGIHDTDYWGDEGFSISLVQKSVGEIIAGTASDVHPPLYYLILKVSYSIFGDNVMTWRGTSLIPTILLILFAATSLKKKYGRKIALLFIILISFLESAINYNVEVRMYSWASFFVFMTFWYAYKLINSDKKKNWILFTVFGILSAYTHYYALLSIALIYFITFIKLIINNRKTLKKIMICMIVCILSYIPWLGYFLSTLSKVQGSFWLESIPSVVSCIKFLIGTNLLGYVLSATLAGAMIVLIYKNRKEIIKGKFKEKQYIKDILKNEDIQMICIGIIVTIGVIFIGIIVSKLIRPLFLTRYLFPLMAIVCLCMSIFVFRVFQKVKIGYFILVIICLSGIYSWSICYKEIWENNEKTQNVVESIKEDDSEKIKLITDISHLSWTVLKLYFDYPYYSYEKVEYDNYLEGTIYLMITNTIDEELQAKLEDDGRNVEFITKTIFAGRYNVNIYRIN